MDGSDRVNPASPGLKLTYDDYLLFPEDGNKHELIDGEHYVTPPPKLGHQGISGNCHFLIRSWLNEHPVGRVYYAPVGVVFSFYDVVEPDLLYLSNERMATSSGWCVLNDWCATDMTVASVFLTR